MGRYSMREYDLNQLLDNKELVEQKLSEFSEKQILKKQQFEKYEDRFLGLGDNWLLLCLLPCSARIDTDKRLQLKESSRDALRTHKRVLQQGTEQGGH